jgi:hypothetical protein
MKTRIESIISQSKEQSDALQNFGFTGCLTD